MTMLIEGTRRILGRGNRTPETSLPQPTLLEQVNTALDARLEKLENIDWIQAKGVMTEVAAAANMIYRTSPELPLSDEAQAELDRMLQSVMRSLRQKWMWKVINSKFILRGLITDTQLHPIGLK